MDNKSRTFSGVQVATIGLNSQGFLCCLWDTLFWQINMEEMRKIRWNGASWDGQWWLIGITSLSLKGKCMYSQGCSKLTVYMFSCRSQKCWLRRCHTEKKVTREVKMQKFQVVPGKYLPRVSDASGLLLPGGGRWKSQVLFRKAWSKSSWCSFTVWKLFR